MEIYHYILGLILVSIALSYGNARWGLPTVAILNRWMRWILFSLVFALFVQQMSETPRPFWLLAITGFLLWLLLETCYNWLAIKALSHSELALFPVFKANTEGDEWPSHKRYFKARETLRRKAFKRIESIKAELDEGIIIRSSVYEDPTQKIRVQAMFIPQRSGSLAMNFIISSITESGRRYITDNVYMPFGGFYPENWYLDRRPLNRVLERLMLVHRKRMKKATESFVPWDVEPLQDLNEQQRILEQTNMKAGFLFPAHHHDEYGRITSEGRYRIWKEIWLLNYFGISTQK